MRLTVSDPAAVPDLLAALRRSECVAARAARSSIDVAFPWVGTLAEARQGLVELAFFARAWEAMHPGVTIRVDATPTE